MAIDEEPGKPTTALQETVGMIWAYTKACPVKAIEQLIPYQIGYRGTKIGLFISRIRYWELIKLNGAEEKFTFGIRNN
ncbi:MAG: hypothetical protein ACLPN1_11730 [Dissulfurispiraceae bacterium]|jgi:hypothetical protein